MKTQRMNQKAFTLIELLVVIAIIGVLVALLLPAVQMAREAGRRAHCANNLKQLGIAAHNYHDSRRFLPPSRLANDAATSPVTSWVTWAVLVLPYMEQEAFYDRWDISRSYESHPEDVTSFAIPGYYCPSRRLPNAVVSNDTPKGATGDYAACGGRGANDGVNKFGLINPNANGAMLCAVWTLNGAKTQVIDWRGSVTIPDVLDGTSNTFLFGEKHVRYSTTPGKLEDRSIYNSGNNNNYRRYAGIDNDGDAQNLARFRANEDDNRKAIDNRSFGSRHAAICQFVLCDGSVRALDEDIDVVTLGRLAHKSDGESVSGEKY